MAAVKPSLLQDSYWKGLIYLFQNHYKLQDCFTTKYFNMESETVKITALKRNAGIWSHSEKIMLNLALHLFNERNKFNLSDLDYLDSTNKQLAMEAIKLRFM